MRYRIVVVACMLPMHIASAGALIENPCRTILSDGFYSEYSRSNAQSRDQAMYAKLCSSNFQQARQAISRIQKSGTDSSFGASYGLFSPGGSGIYSSNGSLDENRFNQWKSAYCSKNSLADSSRAAEFLMQKTTPQSVVDAWSACMRKYEGLTCWATPNVPQHDGILLNVNWTKADSSHPQVQHSFLTRGAASKFTGARTGKILPVGYELNAGTLHIAIARETDKSIVANLQVNHEGMEHSCNVFIPGDRDFALTTPFVRR